MNIKLLIVDSETVGIPFMSISMEEFPVDTESLRKLELYRKALDERMISLAPRKQLLKSQLLEESRRVTRFLNQYKL